MISAEKARKLAGVDRVKEHLDYLEKRITSAAKDGKTELIIRNEPYATWLFNTTYTEEVAVRVVDTLRKEGFTVSQFYEEKQFADLGLKISWA